MSQRLFNETIRPSEYIPTLGELELIYSMLQGFRDDESPKDLYDRLWIIERHIESEMKKRA